MESPAFLDEVEAIDGENLAAGELLGHDAEGAVVVFPLAEGGDEDGVVEYEEIHVGGGEDGQAPAGDFAGLWEVDGEDFVGTPGGGEEIFQAAHVAGEWGVVRGGGVGFVAGEDGVLVGETGEVVDVAVGVVAFDAFLQPEDFGDTEGVAEFLFGVLAGEVGVAVRVKQ